MFDDADHAVELPLQLFGIVDRSKPAVEDVVAALSDERLSLTCGSSNWTRAKILQLPRGLVPCVCHYFHGHIAMDAETVNQLGLVDDDNEVLSNAGDYFLAQERATAALQKIEIAGNNLVRPVDSDVDVIVLCQRGEWDP